MTDLLDRMSAFRNVASWAVWDRDGSGELVAPFPADLASSSVHGRAMIVSLNPGTDRNDETEANTPPWSNFHSPLTKHNDLFLAQALVDTRLWGAYMSDLHPEWAESDSSIVRTKPTEVAAAVAALIHQAKLLGSVQMLVAVGGKTYSSIVRHSDTIEREIGVPRSAIRRITHYSRAAAGAHKHDRALYRASVIAATDDVPPDTPQH